MLFFLYDYPLFIFLLASFPKFIFKSRDITKIAKKFLQFALQ